VPQAEERSDEAAMLSYVPEPAVLQNDRRSQDGEGGCLH